MGAAAAMCGVISITRMVREAVGCVRPTADMPSGTLARCGARARARPSSARCRSRRSHVTDTRQRRLKLSK
eukprot:2976949-Prymnesium_polylepis.1